MKNTTIEVPVKDNHIDYEFMKNFIKVIEKIVIKDVVVWVDEKLKL